MSRFFRLTELKPYVPGEQPADMERLIKLNTNENPYPPSPEAVARRKPAGANGSDFVSQSCALHVSSSTRRGA